MFTADPATGCGRSVVGVPAGGTLLVSSVSCDKGAVVVGFGVADIPTLLEIGAAEVTWV